ncbi:fam-j protein [Plasmodium relictum]|uniref:Fam-j protein n=1 Tax=Plasmodium relictum TaxID=85471 RepID=A0A1J1GKN0_PLARL|nr:fam-j protein [Plasmodium relictum]CRG85622.1 fam-j protein [Plasmodium relictum]
MLANPLRNIKISSNICTRENSPSVRNLIDTVNIEQDEILDLENAYSHFPIEEKNSDSNNKDDFFSMSLVDIINIEKSKSYDIKNILDEVQCSLMDSPMDPFYPSFKNENLPIYIEKESEILSTLPDLKIPPENLLLEHDLINVTDRKPFSVKKLVNTENVEHEDSAEIQDVLGGILRTLPGSQIEPLGLPHEHENSTIHAEAGPSNMSLMDTNVKHEDFYNISNIFSDSSVTPSYSKGGFLELLLEDQCSTINYEDELPSTSNLTIPENVENEGYAKLQIIPVDFSIEKPTRTINDNEDMISVDEIEQISEKSYKRKRKKRNYGDIDNLGDQNIEKDIHISPKKSYVCYLSYSQIEDFVLSLSNIFKMQINCLPDNVVPSLQRLRDILEEDNKVTYDNLKKKISINILLLRDIINEEIKKINPSDLIAIKEYYDTNIKGEKLQKKVNNNILLFRYKTNHEFNIEALHERIEQILKIFEDLSNEYIFLKNLDDLKSTIANDFMHNKLFSFPFFQSLKVFKRIFELLKCMDELIECAEKSIKSGFILRDRNYFCMTQKNISNLYSLIISTIRVNSIKLDNILKTLNLSYKDHGIIVEAIFYFFKKENAKNKEKLRQYLDKPYKENSLKAIYDFLLEEEKYIICCCNEASKIFNLNLNDKNKGSMLFNDLMNNKNTMDCLFFLYETIIKLIGGLFVKKQLFYIMNIRRSLFKMNSLKKRKNIFRAKIINKKLQSDLLSQIEKEKCNIEKIKLNIRNLYLLITTKDDVEIIQVPDSLINKIKGILSILRFIHKLACKNKYRTYFNNAKKVNTENMLLALYYANQRLSKFTENEIQ